jgi:hypothetical protein
MQLPCVIIRDIIFLLGFLLNLVCLRLKFKPLNPERCDKAAWARNSLINNQRGFSPFQIIYGRNPSIPGISDCTTGTMESLTRVAWKIIESMQTVRLQILASEYDHRIRVTIKDRLPRSRNFKYNVGDQVVFKDAKDGRMHDARIVGIDGPVAILRWGNNERRAQLRELLPSREIKLKDHESKEDHKESMEDQTETELDEIIPCKCSTFQRDNEWIIPEISEREVVRMMKAREPDDDSETDNRPTIQIITAVQSRNQKS